MTKKVKETGAFYQQYFGYSVDFDADWYMSLKQDETGDELAILQANHETVPSTFGKSAQGLIFNFEVENVDAVYQQLIKEKQLPLHLDLLEMNGCQAFLERAVESHNQRILLFNGPAVLGWDTFRKNGRKIFDEFIKRTVTVDAGAGSIKA